jgi:hypothetical protein
MLSISFWVMSGEAKLERETSIWEKGRLRERETKRGWNLAVLKS